MRHVLALVLFCLPAMGGCTSDAIRTFEPVDNRPRADFVAYAPTNMVATDDPRATEAGLDMLRAGGNATDAAIAASFVISVVRPQSTGIGGGGFLLYYDSVQKAVSALDFRERAPIAATKDMFLGSDGNVNDYLFNGIRMAKPSINGHLAVGTPGLVAGLIEAHHRFGSLPLKTLMAPAIKYADEGSVVDASLEKAIKTRLTILSNFPASRELFIPNGVPLVAGDTLLQTDLANTLKLISETDGAAFYKGEVADKIVAEMNVHGILTSADLTSYKVISREPLRTRYRDFEIVTMPPPSSGGVHIIQILKMLANDNMQILGFNSDAEIHLLTETMRRAYADRAKYLGDPDFVQIPLQGLLSDDYLHSRRTTISSYQATPSVSLSAGNPPGYESRSTTHISVVDAKGNTVSTTQTINGIFGSGVVAKGTGIVLNNEMDDFSIKDDAPNLYGLVGGKANSIAARKTMLSSMSPTIILDKDQQVFAALGAKGGSRIITAVLQCIVNMVDFGMSLPDAVHATRIHHQWMPDQLEYEQDGLDRLTMRALESRGHVLIENSKEAASVQAIMRTKDGWVGVSDVRSQGKPMGF